MALDAFTKVVKVMNHTRCWACHLILSKCYLPDLPINVLEHNQGIHSFRPTWLCLIANVLATQAKFHELSAYCTVIKSMFIFRTTNIFGYFCNIMIQFELVKPKFQNWCVGSNHTWNETMYNVSVHQPQWVPFIVWISLVTWYMHYKCKIFLNF